MTIKIRATLGSPGSKLGNAITAILLAKILTKMSTNTFIGLDLFSFMRPLSVLLVPRPTVVLREPVANKIKYLSNKSSDQNDQSKSK